MSRSRTGREISSRLCVPKMPIAALACETTSRISSPSGVGKRPSSARLAERVQVQVIRLRFAGQQRVDYLAAEPGAEISCVVCRDHGNTAGRGRGQPFARRESHQHLRLVDWRRTFDPETVVIEQARQLVEAQMIDEATCGTIDTRGQIARMVAEDDVVPAEPQMRK
jgi:hypothetical protein